MEADARINTAKPDTASDLGLTSLHKSNLVTDLAVSMAPAQKPADIEKHSYLQTGTQALVDLAWSPSSRRSASAEQNSHEVSKYLGQAAKTALLFLKGTPAAIGTVALYGLDQASPSDQLSTQLSDFALGGSKGLALKGAFSGYAKLEDMAGKSSSQFFRTAMESNALKGVVLGSTSRLSENLSDSKNYYDPKTGLFDFSGGVTRSLSKSVTGEALVSDMVIFAASAKLMKGTEALSGISFKENRVLGSMATGASFGLTGGTLEEINKQSHEGKNFMTMDWSEVLKRGLISATVDGIAAMPAGIQARGEYLGRKQAALEELKAAKSTAESDTMAEDRMRRVYSQITPDAFGRPNYEPLSLQEAAQHLSAPERGKMFIPELNAAKKVDLVEKPVIIQRLKGSNTEIVTPVDYAAKLAEVRQLRQAAQTSEAAAEKLQNHPLANRALPEDLVAHALQLPTLSPAKSLILLEDPHSPMTPEFQKLHGEGFKAEAYATPNGSIWFSALEAHPTTAQSRYSPISEKVFHEWSHLLRWSNPETAKLYEDALQIDKAAEARKPFSPKDPDESFATFTGENLMHPDSDVFAIAATDAPIASSIAVKTLRQHLGDKSAPNWLENRMKLVEKEIQPMASEALLARLRTPLGPTDSKATVNLLMAIEGPNALAKLSQIPEINLSSSKLTAQELHLIPADSGIKTLTASSAGFGDGHVRAIKDLPLDGLNVSRNPQITDLSVPDLGQMKTLRHLDLSGTGISLDGYLRLVDDLPNTRIVRR